MDASKKVEETKEASSELYPSASVFFNMIQKEYEVERDRKKTVENRLNTCLAFSSALLIYSLSDSSVMTKLALMFSKDVLSQYEVRIAYVCLFLLIMYLLALVKAVVKFIKAIDVRVYKCFEYDEFLREVNCPSDVFLYVAANHYCELIDQARYTNQKKTEDFKDGLHFLLVSIILIVVLKLTIYFI